MYGSQPLGRELIIRLARHLAKGYTKQDQEIVQLFGAANLYLFPMIDYEFFDTSNEGDCSYCRADESNGADGDRCLLYDFFEVDVAHVFRSSNQFSNYFCHFNFLLPFINNEINLINPLLEDCSNLRASLLPDLIKTVQENLKQRKVFIEGFEY